jgi:uncharacterized membrane protein
MSDLSGERHHVLIGQTVVRKVGSPLHSLQQCAVQSLFFAFAFIVCFNSSREGSTLRKVILGLAVAGIVVSALAWQVHYSSAVQPCDINAHWDCGIVNHSRYSMIGPVPVAAIGVAGYLLLALLAWFRRRGWTTLFAWIGVGFAAYLSYLEAYVLQVWCLYCVISQCLIALIAILATINLAMELTNVASTMIERAIKNLRYS